MRSDKRRIAMVRATPGWILLALRVVALHSKYAVRPFKMHFTSKLYSICALFEQIPHSRRVAGLAIQNRSKTPC